MSNFSYPPPPPPPPPQPSTASYSTAQHSGSSQKIPTFQSRGGGRSRKNDSRGGYQGGRGHHNRQSNAHGNPPSGGTLPRSHPNHSPGAPPPIHTGSGQMGYQGQYNAVQPYSASTPPSWNGPQYPGAGPYGNPYAPPMSAHPTQQYHPPPPIPGPPYMSHGPAYSAPIVPAYQTPNYPYPPPPPAPPTSTQPARNDFEDRQRGGQRAQNDHYGSPDSGHGQKRKREQSPHRMQGRPGSSGQPPNKLRGGHSFNQRAKVKAAPAVPSFGFHHGLPPKPPTSLDPAPARAPNAKENREGRKKQKKRKTNQLGLTPKSDVHEASDEDVDEEARYAASGAPITIHYKGRTVNVTTPEEVQAWIAERKKKFPTESRVAERKALQEKRKQATEERRKQAAEDHRKAQKAKKEEQQSRKKVKQRKKKGNDTKSEPLIKDEEAKSPGSSLSKDAQERARKKLEQHMRKAEKLRELLAQAEIKDEVKDDPARETAEVSIKTEPDSSAVDPSSEGLGQEPGTDSSSALESSSDSDSDSSASPEVATTRDKPSFKKVASQPKSDVKVGRHTFTDVPCKYFIRDGHCRRKNCRFLHVITKKEGKLTLFERLKEGEMHEQSLKTLEMIKHLGHHGFFDP